MPKRLTDTEVWKKPWFRKLPPEYKCFWNYLLTDCDFVGVWLEDFDHASYLIGKQIDPTLARNLFSEQILFVEKDKKWVIKGFMKFQYGETLKESSPVHKKILQLLKKHKLRYNSKDNTLSDTLYHRGKEEEEDKEKEKEEEAVKVELEEKEKEEKAQSAVLPFPSEDFSNAWKAWKAYKESQFKFWYKTVDTEQIALKQLSELASGEEQTAIKIIQQSIANGWKGFFELKSKQTQNDGKYTAEDYQQLGNTIDEWFDRKYGV